MTEEDEGPEGLGLPESTEITQIQLDEKWKPEVDYQEMKESGEALYQKIAEESKSHKLHLVVKTSDEMASVRTHIAQACKKIKLVKKVITFDPEDVRKEKNW